MSEQALEFPDSLDAEKRKKRKVLLQSEKNLESAPSNASLKRDAGAFSHGPHP